jgi:hypothetical protein
MDRRNHALINDLHETIVRLRRSEARFVQQLAARRSKLDATGGAVWTDPLHQRLFSMLAKTREELKSVQIMLRRCLLAPAGSR